MVKKETPEQFRARMMTAYEDVGNLNNIAERIRREESLRDVIYAIDATSEGACGPETRITQSSCKEFPRGRYINESDILYLLRRGYAVILKRGKRASIFTDSAATEAL